MQQHLAVDLDAAFGQAQVGLRDVLAGDAQAPLDAHAHAVDVERWVRRARRREENADVLEFVVVGLELDEGDLGQLVELHGIVEPLAARCLGHRVVAGGADEDVGQIEEAGQADVIGRQVEDDLLGQAERFGIGRHQGAQGEIGAPVLERDVALDADADRAVDVDADRDGDVAHVEVLEPEGVLPGVERGADVEADARGRNRRLDRGVELERLAADLEVGRQSDADVGLDAATGLAEIEHHTRRHAFRRFQEFRQLVAREGRQLGEDGDLGIAAEDAAQAAADDEFAVRDAERIAGAAQLVGVHHGQDADAFADRQVAVGVLDHLAQNIDGHGRQIVFVDAARVGLGERQDRGREGDALERRVLDRAVDVGQLEAVDLEHDHRLLLVTVAQESDGGVDFVALPAHPPAEAGR